MLRRLVSVSLSSPAVDGVRKEKERLTAAPRREESVNVKANLGHASGSNLLLPRHQVFGLILTLPWAFEVPWDDSFIFRFSSSSAVTTSICRGMKS